MMNVGRLVILMAFAAANNIPSTKQLNELTMNDNHELYDAVGLTVTDVGCI
jgi:hypothetical protein